ncbi:MAG: hypothetical protein LAP21_07915 [Acidobacteriia bacterium]|nr:hypothetical protein [Terriglobia bacterium]
MARIRTIKPVFARHEKLQELESASPQLRPMLTFCCLWPQCDRAGRFEWRPKQLKLDILPFVDYDLGETMELLAKHDFIRRYEVGGKVYGYVPSWDDHQCPNAKECASRIPAPPQHDTGIVPERLQHDASMAPGQFEHDTGMVQAHGEVEVEVERKKGREGEFNVAETARALAVERGWSGLKVIEQIRLAIAALQAQFPERRPAEIAEWLLKRTHEYDQCAKVKAGFRMSWEKFFGEAHYNDAAENWECRSSGGEPSLRGAVAASHTEDATPIIRERQKKLEEFLARRKQTTQQVQ